VLHCRFFADIDGHLRGFELSGHAGLEKRGDNLVCAGATTLAQTCITSITRLLGLRGEVTTGEAGYLRYTVSEGTSRDADLFFRSMLLGLEYLQKAGGQPSGIKIEYTHSGGTISGS